MGYKRGSIVSASAPVQIIYKVFFFDFFFFKQKTAYEIGWCDWSSDVCSSDLQLNRNAFPSRRCEASDSSRGRSALPIAGSLAAAAMPSRRVDLPEPFSPTKKVTGRWSDRESSVRIAGTVKGKALSSPPRRLTEARWIELTAPTYLRREVFHGAYKRAWRNHQRDAAKALTHNGARYGTCPCESVEGEALCPKRIQSQARDPWARRPTSPTPSFVWGHR